MDQPQPQPDTQATERSGDLFFGPKTESAKPRLLPVAVAAAAVIVTICGVAFMHRAAPAPVSLNKALPIDPYASKLSVTQLAMSESTSLSGGKSTFIDGHARNLGGDTLTGVTVQVFFKNDEGLSPTVVTLPLSIIRTHEPYVDTEPVSAAPLKPGDDVEFRLIFESVPANWNQQMPELRLVHAVRQPNGSH